MELFFLIVWHWGQQHFFLSLYIFCYTSMPPSVGVSVCLANRLVSLPCLLPSSSEGHLHLESVCVEISLCSTQYAKAPLEGFYERSHAGACLSLPTRGWPPHPAASPGLALWFLTLSSKCLCFNRPNFQLSPCALEVSLSHPEQICLFFFFPFFICSSELSVE